MYKRQIRDNTEISAYEADLEAAARLNIKGVVCSVWTPDTGVYTEKFGRLCDLAAAYHLTVNLEFVTWAEAVSYTHLDVYKRQDFFQPLIFVNLHLLCQ